ncbi:MAG: metallophosphoesterase [Egibacteraceae bacterium]
MTVHLEPFVYLAGLTHDDALIAWGGFFFQDPDRDGVGWGIVEDPDIQDVVDEDRRASMGVESRPFGHAEVQVVEVETGEVAARAATDERNHVWVRGLRPDTEYRFEVIVDGEPWADGPRWDWLDQGDGPDLVETDRVYDTRFRTHPAPDTPVSLRFAVLGDYGVGILASGGAGDRQRRLGTALENAVDHAGVSLVITTGDNIYLGEDDTVAGTGNHDDDWYFSFYEPYRYAISRVPVYPGVGNHDTSDTEVSDNRDQLADNLFTNVRFAEGAETDRASLDPGLFYRFSYGSMVHFVAIDSTMSSDLDQKHFVEHDRHRAFLEEELVDGPDGWVIPFSHHPPYCAGPSHGDAAHLVDVVVPLLAQGGVPVMFCGHEHNFQHNHVRGIDYVVTGAAGKVREERPDRFDEAGTQSWAAEGHFLIVDVDDQQMTIHPVTDVDTDGTFTYLRRTTPDDQETTAPITVRRAGRST